jgi:hypothetical protein
MYYGTSIRANYHKANRARIRADFKNEIKIEYFNFDEFVKSRHSGENRSPDGPQLLENTGFRLLPE